MIPYYGNIKCKLGGGGKILSAPLNDLGKIIPSCVFDVDATQIDSYGGTGNIWRNLCANPADGEDQDAYDFIQRGTQSFEGTAGSPNAHFLSTGNGGWNADATDFVRNMARTDLNLKYTLAFVFETGDDVVTGIKGLFGVPSNNVLLGANLRLSATTARFQVRHQDGESTASFLPPANVFALAPYTKYLMIVAVDSTTGNCTLTVNGTTITGNLSPLLENTTMAGQLLVGLFASPSGTGWFWPSGAKFVAASLFNSFFTDSDERMLSTIYKRRHKRDYDES